MKFCYIDPPDNLKLASHSENVTITPQWITLKTYHHKHTNVTFVTSRMRDPIAMVTMRPWSGQRRPISACLLQNSGTSSSTPTWRTSTQTVWTHPVRPSDTRVAHVHRRHSMKWQKTQPLLVTLSNCDVD